MLKSLLLITAVCCSGLVRGQKPAITFATIQSAIDTARKQYPEEKLYLQFDKTDYVIGDTAWFKAYLFNASYFTPSAQSGILYVDIANSDSVVIKQFRVAVAAGVSWGNIALNKQEFKEGTYILRAYTNWMRNFGSTYFFYHRFSVAGTTAGWLVNSQQQVHTINGNDSIRVKLQFSDVSKRALQDKPLDLQVIAGSKTLYRSSITTTHNGGADVNFIVPSKPQPISIAATDKPSSKKIIIPLQLNRPGNIDLQLPEGGYLVAGLPAHIAFKAIGEDGHGVDVKGVIVNDVNQQITAFKSLHKGMGSLNLLPVAGEAYTAKLALPDGTVKNIALPAVKPAGTTLRISNAYGDDSLTITIAAAPGFLPADNKLFLVAQARNVLCYGAALNVGNDVIKKRVAKGLFPAGIARITLFTAGGTPVNERLVFIDARDGMHIDISTNDSIYNTRDSVAVNISAMDTDNSLLAGNFSMSVTDDEQAGSYIANRQNIATSMMLSSSLQGYVETPGYYFQPGNDTAWQALDNLLLTQGWAGYSWQQVFNPPTIAFTPERELTIKGKALNVLNKGIANSHVALLSVRPALFMDTVTDAAGQFVFNHFPPVDTPLFSIQARNKNGKSFNVGIQMDETPPPAFLMPVIPQELPWYVNTDTAVLQSLQQQQLRQASITQGMTLQDVVVRSIKKVEGSKNLNGAGNADMVLNEADMDKRYKKTLLDMLQETIKNFRVLPLNRFRWFYIEDKPVYLIFDGVNIDDVYEVSSYPEMKSLLDRFTAEDIKGIELNISPANRLKYITRFIPIDKQQGFDYAFIEITTRAGTGPTLNSIPGAYVYKSTPFYWPKVFYSPRYAVKDTSDHSIDLRSTIYWAPNIITQPGSKTTLAFYAADRPTTYTILVEGTDFNGNVAVKAKRITIKAKQ